MYILGGVGDSGSYLNDIWIALSQGAHHCLFYKAGEECSLCEENYTLASEDKSKCQSCPKESIDWKGPYYCNVYNCVTYIPGENCTICDTNY